MRINRHLTRLLHARIYIRYISIQDIYAVASWSSPVPFAMFYSLDVTALSLAHSVLSVGVSRGEGVAGEQGRIYRRCSWCQAHNHTQLHKYHVQIIFNQRGSYFLLKNYEEGLLGSNLMSNDLAPFHLL